MGAWDIGVFENDSASDWVFDLVEETELDLIISTLHKAVEYNNVEEDDLLEEPDGSEALAAAEVVAALSGNPSSDLPEEIINWLNGIQTRNEDLMALARNAIEVVKTKSELRELWEESDEFDTWVSILDGLLQRLK